MTGIEDDKELAKMVEKNLCAAHNLSQMLKALEYEGIKLKWHGELESLLSDALMAYTDLHYHLKRDGVL